MVDGLSALKPTIATRNYNQAENYTAVALPRQEATIFTFENEEVLALDAQVLFPFTVR